MVLKERFNSFLLAAGLTVASLGASASAEAGQWAKAGAVGLAAEALSGIGERMLNTDTAGAIDTALVHHVMEDGSFTASSGVDIEVKAEIGDVDANNSAVNIAVTEATESKVTSLDVEQDIKVKKVNAKDSRVDIGMVALNGFKGNSVNVRQDIEVNTVTAKGSSVKVGGAYLGNK